MTELLEFTTTKLKTLSIEQQNAIAHNVQSSIISFGTFSKSLRFFIKRIPLEAIAITVVAHILNYA